MNKVDLQECYCFMLGGAFVWPTFSPSEEAAWRGVYHYHFARRLSKHEKEMKEQKEQLLRLGYQLVSGTFIFEEPAEKTDL